MIFHRELEANLRVCPHCGHHMRLGAKKRLAILFDDGEYTKIELPKTIVDPLRFRDRKRYSDRLKESQGTTGEPDAAIVAHGKIGGMDAVVAVLDFAFMGGSMGIAVGEAIVAAAKLAVLQEAPFVVVPASGGARMQEGILSLMQMPRTMIAVEQVKEAGLPYIVLLTDPTTGGVSASFAMLGDIQLAEPGAMIGFAGRRVIEETIRESLPDGFQRAEYLLGARHRRHGGAAPPAARDAWRACSACCASRSRPRPSRRRRARSGAPTRPRERDLRHGPTISPDPILERLKRLHPLVIDLSLDRIERLLDALGHPERRLPPVVHVAGTNGKGSTVAFMRAALEAAGFTAHVYTSPHLVRFNERIVVAGKTIDDATARRHPGGVRDGQCRRAHHLLRDHHGRGVRRLRARPRRLRADRGRPRRPARRDQSGRAPGARPRSRRSRSTIRAISATRSTPSPARRPAS